MTLMAAVLKSQISFHKTDDTIEIYDVNHKASIHLFKWLILSKLSCSSPSYNQPNFALV